MIEEALRNEHLRIALQNYTTRTGPALDIDAELYVAVLSNAIHLGADTGRVITCPFIPGRLADDAMAMVVAVAPPEGTRFYRNSCSGFLGCAR